tara:strand:+ start:438 stop:1262 length:825 start_codon:yes stop_codon:yes gene_type:complete
MYRSADSGRTWSEKISTGIKGHICPCIFKTKSGKIIIGADRVGPRDNPEIIWIHNAFTSNDNGYTWSPMGHVCSRADLWLNEGTYVELDDGTLVCYLREDIKRDCGYKAISKDGGQTWSGPYPTFLNSCVGRPQAGRLNSGEIAIVHGFQRFTPPRNLVLHVETQEIAGDPDCVANHQNSSGHRYFFIDHDRSIHADGAYSGWVQRNSGDLFVVQYINDDSPYAHIRSYEISRSDWILCPEGDLLYEPPRWPGYVDRTTSTSGKLYGNSLNGEE